MTLPPSAAPQVARVMRVGSSPIIRVSLGPSSSSPGKQYKSRLRPLRPSGHHGGEPAPGAQRQQLMLDLRASPNCAGAHRRDVSRRAQSTGDPPVARATAAVLVTNLGAGRG